MSDWVKVGSVDDIAEGAHVVIDVDNVMVVVFNMGGEFFAYEDACPHDGSDIASGCIKNGILECAHHGATFDLATGEVLTAPAYEPLEKIALRIEGGVIEVRDDRWE